MSAPVPTPSTPLAPLTPAEREVIRGAVDEAPALRPALLAELAAIINGGRS